MVQTSERGGPRASARQGRSGWSVVGMSRRGVRPHAFGGPHAVNDCGEGSLRLRGNSLAGRDGMARGSCPLVIIWLAPTGTSRRATRLSTPSRQPGARVSPSRRVAVSCALPAGALPGDPFGSLRRIDDRSACRNAGSELPIHKRVSTDHLRSYPTIRNYSAPCAVGRHKRSSTQCVAGT